MSLLRYNAKRDSNEGEIVTALEKLGVWVTPISAADLPDLLCAARGKLFWLEVKSKTGRMTEGQKQFSNRCRVERIPYYVVTGLKDLEDLQWLL